MDNRELVHLVSAEPARMDEVLEVLDIGADRQLILGVKRVKVACVFDRKSQTFGDVYELVENKEDPQPAHISINDPANQCRHGTPLRYECDECVAASGGALAP